MLDVSLSQVSEFSDIKKKCIQVLKELIFFQFLGYSNFLTLLGYFFLLAFKALQERGALVLHPLLISTGRKENGSRTDLERTKLITISIFFV